MPLDIKIIDIPLYGGLDTKTEDKLVSPSKSLILENAVMQRTGEINKRNGYEEMPIGSTNSVGLLADDEIKSGNSLHSY